MICLLGSATVAYGVATIAFVLYLTRQSPRISAAASLGLAVGWGLHFGAVVVGWISHEGWSATHGLSLLGLFITAGYLLIQLRWRTPVVGAFISPVIFLVAFVATLYPGGIDTIPQALRSPWFPIHVSFAFIGDAAFAISAGVAAAYLVQERRFKRKKLGGLWRKLPPLEVLDRMNLRCVSIGFPMLTLAIITGSVYAKEIWGVYWSWDVKQVTSVVIWAVFAVSLHARYAIGWRGRRAAQLSIVGFLLAAFSLVSRTMFEIGRHSGGFQ